MARYIDCDKCYHDRVCAYRHQYHDMITDCNHHIPKAEIERLKTENLILSQKRFNIFQRLEYAEKIKSKARKEFVERWYKLLKEAKSRMITIPNEVEKALGIASSITDSVVKEMEGDTK